MTLMARQTLGICVPSRPGFALAGGVAARPAPANDATAYSAQMARMPLFNSAPLPVHKCFKTPQFLICPPTLNDVICMQTSTHTVKAMHV